MKSLLLIITITMMTLVGYSQTSPSKGTTKITIKNQVSAKENFELMISKLLDEQYFIETKDTVLNLIKTQPKNAKGFTYYLNIRAKANEIDIMGSFNDGLTIKMGAISANPSYQEIVFRGMKGSLFRKAWDVMEAFAKKISPELSYQ